MRRETAMRSGLAALIVAAVVVGFWWLRSPEATLVKVGQQAPDLELQSLGATSKTRLSSFRGRPVLLAMFLSNCHICDAEMPEIERLHRQMLPRGLAVIGVSADTERAALQQFAQRHQITFPVLEDPGGARSLLLSDGSREPLDPTTLALGRDGVLRCAVKGGHAARFGRGAQVTLGLALEESPPGSGCFSLTIGGIRHPIADR